MPAAWTAAGLTFQAASESEGTFNDVYDDAGTELSIAADASRVVVNKDLMQKLKGLQYVKIRSGTTGTPVVQIDERTLTLVMKH